MRVRQAAKAQGGGARVTRDGEVLMVEFEGHVTGDVAVAAVAQIETHLAENAAPYLIIDARSIAGYSPDVRGPGVDLLRAAKRSGMLGGVCVAPSGPVRMIGAAVAFVAALPIEFVDTRAQANQAIERRRAGA